MSTMPRLAEVVLFRAEDLSAKASLKASRHMILISQAAKS